MIKKADSGKLCRAWSVVSPAPTISSIALKIFRCGFYRTLNNEDKFNTKTKVYEKIFKDGKVQNVINYINHVKVYKTHSELSTVALVHSFHVTISMSKSYKLILTTFISL